MNFYSTSRNPENLENIINVVKMYVEKLLGLNYLSFLREENKNVVFVGGNGSGKTTLLKRLRDEYLGDITLEG